MIKLVLCTAVLATTALALTGCVAARYHTIAYDTPKPAEVSGLPGCRSHGLEVSPQVNAPCLTLVHARNWQTRTDVAVDAGEVWCIDVPPGQRWFDKSRISSPRHGEPGNRTMNLLAGSKRIPSAPWFTLVVAVLTDAGQEVDRQAVTNPANACAGQEFRPSQKGMLVFYPNDGDAPSVDHAFFYGNNGGQIWVKLTRVR